MRSTILSRWLIWSLLIIISVFTAKNTYAQTTKTYTVNGVSFTMVFVEGGSFTMGATAEQGNDAWENEKPAHQVTLSSFCIGETEVTQALWVAVMGSNPSRFTGNSLRPVELISWNDCQAFITKLNQMTGLKFRLPTEAEWEYAARGGYNSLGYKYAGSNIIDDVAWYWDNAGKVDSSNPNYGTHIIKTKAPNELGLYDMSGNVWEWCHDWYNTNYYSSSPSTNPTGPTSGTHKVLRGGSWSTNAAGERVSNRDFFRPTLTGNDLGLSLGLRLALEPIVATGITVEPIAMTITAGETTQLNLTITPDNATFKTAIWVSSDEAVATVDENGLVTGITSGQALITATTTDGTELSATSVVTVLPRKANGITITPDSVTLDISGSVRLTATITPEDVESNVLLWQSSDEDVAIVTSTGMVYGVGAGQALITATTTDGSELSDTCHVTVRVPFELSAQSVAVPVNTLRNIPVTIDNHVPVKSFGLTITLPDSIRFDSDAMPAPRCADFNVTTTYNADSTVIRIEGVMTTTAMAPGTAAFVLLPIKSTKYINTFEIHLSDISFTSTNDGVGTEELDPITVTMRVLDLGDVNGDKKVDVDDVNTLINYILDLDTDLTNFGVGDMNNDGIIDVADVNAIINLILGVWEE